MPGPLAVHLKLFRHAEWELQRLFADYVGVTPKRAIRRYRLVNAAERVTRQQDAEWDLPVRELGYSDQSHLVRDFTSVIGMSPARYAAARGPGRLNGKIRAGHLTAPGSVRCSTARLFLSLD